jgi:hypothetical protein
MSTTHPCEARLAIVREGRSLAAGALELRVEARPAS